MFNTLIYFNMKNTKIAQFGAHKGHYVSMSASELAKLNRNSKNRLVGDETAKLTSRKHIDILAEDMRDWKDMFPVITVNTVTNNIIDGQNRREAFFKAIEKGWIPEDSTFDVKLISLEEEKEIELIIKMNNQQKAWVADDCVHSYLSDNENYQRLVAFCNEHPYFLAKNGTPRYRSASSLINGKINTKAINNGTFTCTDEDCDVAERNLKEVMKLVESFNYKNAAPSTWFESLASVYVTVKNEILVPNNIPFGIFKAKVDKNIIKRMVYKNKRDFEITLRNSANLCLLEQQKAA